jgi:serine/threonine protein kinase
VAKALDAIGIKESTRTRRVGSWVLRLDTVSERPGIQDFVADHESQPGVTRRIRVYSRVPQMSDEQAQSLRAAADREFLATDRLDHPNVVRAYDRIDTDLGAAVVLAYDRRAERLDHWLATQAELSLDDRLSVLRQLAETLRAVHRRKLTHRALSPGSVLVRPGGAGEPRWVVLVTDFSLAGRDPGASTGVASTGVAPTAVGAGGTRTFTRFGLPTAAPGDVELLADESAWVYQAPEVSTDDDPDGVSLDVFSFGALAFLVLSGSPPGDTPDAVREVLHHARGLQLSSVVPGTVPALHDLVFAATRPLVSERTTGFEEVLVHLDCAEEQLTAPNPPDATDVEAPEIDPLDAKVSEILGDGAVVRRRLGRGSTAVALLVDRGEDITPREVVYKMALGPDAERRLADEARILIPLRHPGVVQAFGETELAGRRVLVEALAGVTSLADELRHHGTPGVEYLQRWGADLLDALRYLEREGRSHRDIKPDNLGVTEVGPNREQHLVLFDFSLAGAPPSDLRAGTPPYLDPFLAERPTRQWDLDAERYAAAVTLYEMTTGEVPRWGDGRSDPAFTTTEVTLDPLLFDPAVRLELTDFFTRALRRNPRDRFGNGDEMLAAWNRVFEGLDEVVTDRHADPGPGPDDSASTSAEVTTRLPDGLELDDPVSSLMASGKVLSALARLDVATVRQLAALAPAQVTRARRISPRLRRRIQELRSAVLDRFADTLAEERSRAVTVPATTDVSPTPGTGLGPDGGGATALATPPLTLEQLGPLLVPPARGRGPKGSTTSAARMLLGLEPVPGAAGVDWPTQTMVADALGVTRGRLGQIGPSIRRHWVDLAPLASLRDDVVAIVGGLGGVGAVSEVTTVVAEARGTGLSTTTALAWARAAVRAAVEAEEARADGDPRLVVRRRGARVVLALDLDADGTGPQVGPGADGAEAALYGDFDGAALAAFAVSLADRADEVLRLAEDVVPQDRAVSVLREVTAPDGVALSDGRLVRLAAACSQTAGVSTALELYPTALDPVRAVRLVRQALASAETLTVDDVRDRVGARFPLVTLPDRPALDDVLADADLAVLWDPEHLPSGIYRRPDTAVGELSTVAPAYSRAGTRVANPSRPAVAPADPAVAAAAELEARLQRSLAHGGFLALRVPTPHRVELQRELARFTGPPHGLHVVDLERVFLAELRAVAAAQRVQWERLVTADLDSEGTTGYTNLRIFTREAAARTADHVRHAGERVLAWNPGILVRYGHMAVIDQLRGIAGLADSDLQTLWLVVFGSTAESKPSIDGQVLPVQGASEWVDITVDWLRNAQGSPSAAG